uniref:LRRNT domain-containing protein n=1 Tax=Biomphalaria glabrata TaxID=6526 RepID=A0A2C9LIK7_BIOGL
MGIQHKVLFLYLFFIGVEGWFGNHCEHKCTCIHNRCLEDDQCNSGVSVRTNELLVTSFPSLSPELVLDGNGDTCTGNITMLHLQFLTPLQFFELRLTLRHDDSIKNFRFYFWNGIHMIECDRLNILMLMDNTLDIRCRLRASVNQLIIYTHEPREFCSIHFYDGKLGFVTSHN